MAPRRKRGGDVVCVCVRVCVCVCVRARADEWRWRCELTIGPMTCRVRLCDVEREARKEFGGPWGHQVLKAALSVRMFSI